MNGYHTDIEKKSQDNSHFREVLFTGDFFVAPQRTVFDLEAALRNVPITEAAAAIEGFFARTPVGLLSVSPADFAAALSAATGR